MSKLEDKTVEENEDKPDVRDFQSNSSSEDSSSVVFSWNATTLRNFVNSRGREEGEVTSTAFFLCTCACLLLTTFMLIWTICTWSMIYHIPLVTVADSNEQKWMNVLCLISAILNLPTVWLTWLSHNDNKNFVFLPLIILILILAASLSATSMSMGIRIEQKIPLNLTGTPPYLLTSSFKDSLNDRMHKTMALYEHSESYRISWDETQEKLHCCGINNYTDWIHFSMEIPYSCYINNRNGSYSSTPISTLETNLTNDKIFEQTGCLDKIAHYFFWEVQLITVAIFVTFLMQILTIIVSGIIYFKIKLSH